MKCWESLQAIAIALIAVLGLSTDAIARGDRTKPEKRTIASAPIVIRIFVTRMFLPFFGEEGCSVGRWHRRDDHRRVARGGGTRPPDQGTHGGAH
jgi:hypothetical protein